MAGSTLQFDEFVAARYSALVRLGVLLSGDAGQGEELTQSALVRVYRHWGRISSGDPEAYTRTVLARLAWRSARRRWHSEYPTDTLPERSIHDASADLETAHVVRSALASLPARQRVVLVLRFWADLSESEISAVLGVRAGTVKSRLHRALSALRDSGLLDDLAPRGWRR